jgi:hypothetical protein
MGDGRQYAEYVNVPRSIGTVVSARLATMAELNTTLGSEDVLDMLEILGVDEHNKRVASKTED